jgi:hypothetical protein
MAHWSGEFISQPVESEAATRAAVVQRYTARGEQSKFYLDSLWVNECKKVWIVWIPYREDRVPGEQEMVIKRKNGRIGWIRKK